MFSFHKPLRALALSSLDVGLGLAAGAADAGCRIFQHRDFGGSRFTLGHLDRMKMVKGEDLGCKTGDGASCGDVFFRPSWNDQVSSFKVTPGCTLTLWHHVIQGGAHFVPPKATAMSEAIGTTRRLRRCAFADNGKLPQPTNEGAMIMTRKLLRLSLLAAAPLVIFAAHAQRQCPADRPCILSVHNVRANLVVEWNDTEERDHYNPRWSRPGKDVVQVEKAGGRGGNFTLKNFHPNVRYTFAVQGCRKPLVGRSTCSPWYDETVTSCGARATPCR